MVPATTMRPLVLVIEYRVYPSHYEGIRRLCKTSPNKGGGGGSRASSLDRRFAPPGRDAVFSPCHSRDSARHATWPRVCRVHASKAHFREPPWYEPLLGEGGGLGGDCFLVRLTHFFLPCLPFFRGGACRDDRAAYFCRAQAPWRLPVPCSQALTLRGASVLRMRTQPQGGTGGKSIALPV